MKKIYLIIVIIFLNCTFFEKKPNSEKKLKTPVKKEIKNTKQKTIDNTLNFNEVISYRLIELKEAINEKDKSKIATFFNFPIKNNHPTPFISYPKSEKFSKQEIHRKDFFELIEIGEHDELLDILRNLNLEKLQTTNIIKKKIKEEDCYYYYEIKLEPKKRTIQLRIDINGGESFETNKFYIFKIIHKELKYSRSMMAG